MRILKLTNRLSDGSETFDLLLCGDLRLTAVTEADAEALIHTLKVAIEFHTNSTVEREG